MRQPFITGAEKTDRQTAEETDRLTNGRSAGQHFRMQPAAHSAMSCVCETRAVKLRTPRRSTLVIRLAPSVCCTKRLQRTRLIISCEREWRQKKHTYTLYVLLRGNGTKRISRTVLPFNWTNSRSVRNGATLSQTHERQSPEASLGVCRLQ